MSTKHLEVFKGSETFTSREPTQHSDAIALDGLEHIFKWASEVVADGEDTRVKFAREKRIRRQVLEIVQKFRDSKLLSEIKDENAYLQRRVIALLQKIQEITEEHSAAKQIIVSQYYALQRVTELEREVKRLKSIEFEREAAVTERRYLMNALAKLKADRDFLEELLITNENENDRLAKLLVDARTEAAALKARKWWHFFFLAPGKKKGQTG